MILLFSVYPILQIDGLDKFQVELDILSPAENGKLYGVFLSLSKYTLRATVRKCIVLPQLVTQQEGLKQLFEELCVSEEEAKEIVKTKYWDVQSPNPKEFIITV